MAEMLQIFDNARSEEGLPSDKLEIIELCVSSIKQMANSKQTFREFLAFSPINR